MGLPFVILGLIGLGLMVFVHELGHFFAARVLGIKVEAFALGWGPTVLRKRGKHAEYRLAAFPIGGYCKMVGEQDMVDALARKAERLDPSPGSFYAAAPWKRMIVSFAGPFVNLVVAVVLMALVWGFGTSYQSTDNRIVMLSDYPVFRSTDDGTPLASLDSTTSPAAAAGLKTGDRIVAIDGKPTESFRDIQSAVSVAARRSLAVSVERAGSRFELTVTPLLDPDTGSGRIGIRPWLDPVVAVPRGSAAAAGLAAGDRIAAIGGAPVIQAFDIDAWLADHPGPAPLTIERSGSRLELTVIPDEDDSGRRHLAIDYQVATYTTPPLSPPAALAKGFASSWDTLALTVRSLGMLFSGLNPTKAVSGPVRITYYIGEVSNQGFANGIGDGLRSFAHILAFVSIALFFGNLLPIPALDGGQILLFIGEALSRRPLNPLFVQRYQLVGAALVFGLLIFALLGDVLFLFGL